MSRLGNSGSLTLKANEATEAPVRLDVPHVECRLGINGKYEWRFLTDAAAPTSRNSGPGSCTVLIHQYVNEDGHHSRVRRPETEEISESYRLEKAEIKRI